MVGGSPMESGGEVPDHRYHNGNECPVDDLSGKAATGRNMKEIVQKLVRAEREMAAEKGEFLLFALFLPEDGAGLWDLVVASPWIATNEADALRYIADKVKSVL